MQTSLSGYRVVFAPVALLGITELPPTLPCPALQCFERGWFANRRCLDVGCNEGVVTLAMATKFGCRSMMGVDIDEHLIRKACT